MSIRIKLYLIAKCILTIGYACLIYGASSEDTSYIALPPYLDKLIHFIEFGLLCFLTCWSLSLVPFGRKAIIMLAIAITSVYGASDEFHQFFTPHRSVDVFDWMADTAGAIAAGFLWQKISHKQHVKEKLLAMGKTPINM